MVELRKKDNAFYSALFLLPWAFYMGQVECRARWGNVRIWDSPRMWTYPLLTLESGPSYLLLDFWRPKEGHSPGPGSHGGPMLTVGVSNEQDTIPILQELTAWWGEAQTWNTKRCKIWRGGPVIGTDGRGDMTSEPSQRKSPGQKGRRRHLGARGTEAWENVACSGSCKLLGEAGNEGMRRKMKGDLKQESLDVRLWSNIHSMLSLAVTL